MRIVMKKIPTLAKWFYLVGFFILAIAMLVFFYLPSLLNPVHVQQGFIAGAIIVAMGSVVNLIVQLKPNSRDSED